MDNFYPYLGKKDSRLPINYHGDLPYADDPILDPFAPRAYQDKREAVPGDDLPFVGEPALNPEDDPLDPPVPNRAWTEMKNGVDMDDISDVDKQDMFDGYDSF